MFKEGIIALLFSVLAMANVPITGQVFTFDGNPLGFAVITDDTGQNWVIADEHGQFNYHFHYITGDTLGVSRYGYQEGKLLITNKSFYTIALKPQPIQQEDITISGESQNFYGQIINTYQASIGNDNPQSVFRQIPGITIRSYGGNAGIMTLSTNGSSAVNTKILLEDIDLTSAQNGETDLSQIPEILINSVKVVNSPGILYGSGTVDGVLRISPRNQQTFFSVSTGSYGLGSLSSNISVNWRKWVTNLSAGYLKDNGDFRYSINDSNVTRSNNDFERKYITLLITGRLSNKSNLNALLLESQQERGVTGTIDWASPKARRDDNLKIAALTFKQLHTNGYSKVQLSYRRSLETYNDPWLLISSEHDVLGTGLKLQHHRKIWNNITCELLYERKLEKLESTDVGDHQRNTNSIASIVTIPVLGNVRIIPALRFDRTGSKQFQPTVDIRLTYNKLKGSEIEYHYGTGFRYPTFNDLYWLPGGNPDLDPEKSWYQIIKYKLYLDDNYQNNFYLNIGGRYTDNLIQWVPIDESFFVWQPQNIASSRRTNFTIGSQFNLENLPIQIALHATFQKTEDINLDKPLFYAPEFVGYAGVLYSSSIIQISINAHYTGERISSYGYPEDELLPPYIQTNATFQYLLSLFGNQFSLMLDINNVLDRQFESIDRYPEPGRTIRLGLKYLLTNK